MRPGPRGSAREIEHSLAEPEASGRFVLEVDEEGEWRRAGSAGLRRREQAQSDREPRRARDPSGLPWTALADEAARVFQRHLLLDLDYHRLQLEIYGFNERAIKHAERAGLHP